MPRRVVIAALALAGVAALPGAAIAGKTQESIFQDDQPGALGSANTPSVLDELHGTLGVDTIHTLLIWRNIAPNGLSKKKPRFNAADPAAYNPGAWDRLDNIVRLASARGMSVIVSPTGPAPLWASRCKRKSTTCDPNPKEFKSFVTAVAKRYTGAYFDENGGGPLPRVSRWSLWNEPNQGGWLTPQFAKKSGRTIAWAPQMYRGLFNAGVSGLKKAGHRRDAVLLGETAPIGRTTGPILTRPVAPGLFYRELFCLDGSGRKLSSRERKLRGCPASFKLAAAGVAHHPYNRAGAGKPTGSFPKDHIQIGTLSRLEKVLKQGARAHRIRSRAPIYLTEMGWQTNPPDRIGLPLGRAAEYLNQSDWIAYNDSSVRGVGQYLLIDPSDDSTFQTGLRQPGGAEKPSYGAYRLPIWVTKSGSSVKVWGQVRPGGSGEVVNIQNNAGGSFQTVSTITTSNARGYFQVKVPKRGGSWRLEWKGRVSREAKVAKR